MSAPFLGPRTPQVSPSYISRGTRRARRTASDASKKKLQRRRLEPSASFPGNTTRRPRECSRRCGEKDGVLLVLSKICVLVIMRVSPWESRRYSCSAMRCEVCRKRSVMHATSLSRYRCTERKNHLMSPSRPALSSFQQEKDINTLSHPQYVLHGRGDVSRRTCSSTILGSNQDTRAMRLL